MKDIIFYQQIPKRERRIQFRTAEKASYQLDPTYDWINIKAFLIYINWS